MGPGFRQDDGGDFRRRSYATFSSSRKPLISLVSIPLSLLVAVMALKALGWTLNVMTLGGLILALGLVIDDAVIDVENILARLREADRRHAAHPDAILAAGLEVRGPVIYATAVVIAVFIPELLTSSVQGHFVGPLALAFVFAVSASLLVAMTTTPADICGVIRREPSEDA